MSFEDAAICVDNISKNYQIYKHPKDRLKQAIFSRIQQLTLKKKGGMYYKDFWALKNISFKVNRGETVGILGRNGSGKSTLLQVVCGILTPSSGFCKVQGNLAALLELGSGFNPQFTGLENVYVYGQLLGLSRKRLDEILPTILDFADIGDFIHQPVKTYSSGMLVRLAFAVSVSREPDILVVDEALAVGDAAFSRKCFARIETLREKGTTVLFVSHSSSMIVEICDRAIILDGGEMIYDGIPKEAVAHYTKLLFSPESKRKQIREETKEAWQQKNIINNNETVVLTSSIEKNLTNKVYSPFFVEDMISKSRLEYESQGATILDPHIRTTNGKRVNVLIESESYQYCYRVKFHKKAWNVNFGMLIKTNSGYELGGGAHPFVNKYIACVEEGVEYFVAFDFKCLLADGVYFCNAGIQGSPKPDVDRRYLHRVIDAIMFKVLPHENPQSTANVNFMIGSTAKNVLAA